MCCDTCYLWIPVCPVALLPPPITHVCVAFRGRARDSSPPPSLWLMNVVEIHNQVPMLLICPPFPPTTGFPPLHHQNSKCSIGGPIIPKLRIPLFWSCGPVRIDIECTLTLDCVGCLIFRENRLHSIHSNVIFSHHISCPPHFLAICSYCSSHIGID